MDRLNELLNKINTIISEEKTIQEEKRKRGENFNIFDILKLSKNECRLHSAFLTELLNPNGSHGLKDVFLKLFLQYIVPDSKLKTETAVVKIEYNIGTINEDKTDGGRIDILITDNQNQAIIIENKIDASDQENQLLRYNNYATKNYTNVVLLYLTKNGKEASDKSTKGEPFKYSPISYQKDILQWLNCCVEKSACFPLIRETIKQYIINLKQILHIMDTENTNKLIETVTSKDYIEATLAILENESDIQKKIRKQFIEQLKDIAERKKFEFYCDKGVCDLSSNNAALITFTFTKPPVLKDWNISIGCDTLADGFYYGVGRQETEKTKEIHKEIIEKSQPIWEEIHKDKDFPFGGAYLHGKDGNWNRWDDYNTLKDMADGTLSKYIEVEIINKVIESNLLKQVEDITSKDSVTVPNDPNNI
jgi:hypothetical protein